MPKPLYLLPLILLFHSCKQKDIKKKHTSDKTAFSQNTTISKVTTNPASDTVLNITAEYVDGQKFTVNCTKGKNYKLFILNGNKDTIYRDYVYPPTPTFTDFNGDGYKDIMLDYMTNVPGISDLLLYDKTSKAFKVVAGFQNFPDPKKLALTNYYYSYHRSGCADMDWTSDLFYISGFRAIKIASINGYQCKDRDIRDGIYIYRVKGEKEILIKHLPINLIEGYKDYKWGFIKHYWTTNYRLFL